MPPLDFAVRNTRVLARYAARQVRQGEPAPQLAGAVRELASAVWLLAAHYEQPERAVDVRHVALAAARDGGGHPRPRAVAADDADRRPGALGRGRPRARGRGARRPGRGAPEWDLPTEELLAV